MLGVLALIGLVVGSVISFQSPNDSQSVSGDPNLVDGVRVHVSVLKVVPEADHLLIRMAFEPVGSLAKDRHFLTQPVRVVISAGASVIDETYQTGEIMPPRDIEVDLDGSIAEFPLDRYESTFEVTVSGKDGSPVQSVLLVDASAHGYQLTAADPISELNGGHDMTMTIARSAATVVFGYFVMGLMWALTALAVVMAVAEIRRKEPIEGSLISFLGVLLFAFPSIRNSIPNSPPLGVLSDFVAYFWCEFVIGVTLVAVLATHATRKVRQARAERG